MPRVVLPLPTEEFDPTESSVPWRHLRSAGIEVAFATPDGKPAACDPMSLEGVVFGSIGAKPADAATYHEMAEDAAFRAPLAYEDIDASEFDGVHLTGGHAPGMRPYLESEVLQSRIVDFVGQDKVVSGICHGPILLARTVDPMTKRSVVHGRRMTALTKLLERSGYWLTMWTLGKRFRTYPAYVQDEMVEAMGDANAFETGPLIPSYGNPFTVRDGNLLTGRWPGDADKLGA
ncbi:MAG: type 1 glutamine amidotransferase domain-containing protein, partial [Nannocystaceae bacterium]|nr:type 1 glutamine amidotransferase domain-containing protein [Nannocystaceae bacterium]